MVFASQIPKYFIPLGIMQETEIWPYKQMVHAQTRIFLREWDP